MGFFFQARILEWVAIFSSKGSCQPRDRTHISRIAGRFLTAEPSGKPLSVVKWTSNLCLCTDCFIWVFKFHGKVYKITLIIITLPAKVHLVKAMVFPVVIFGCESWTIKIAECRIDAFELWYWWRLLRVPWTARRSNQSILKENSPQCSLKGLMLKLKLQNFSHLLRRADSLKRPWCWERLRAGGERDDRGWNGWMASPTLGVSDGQGGLACCGPWGCKELDITERLNWTDPFDVCSIWRVIISHSWYR